MLLHYANSTLAAPLSLEAAYTMELPEVELQYHVVAQR